MISFIIVLVAAAVAQMSFVDVVHAQGTWTQQVSPATLSLVSVKAVNQKVAWASGNGGAVVRCIDGSTWTKVDGGAFGTNWNFYFICAINADTALVSIFKGINTEAPRLLSDTTWIYRTTNGGSSWHIVFQQIGGLIEDMQMIDSLNGFAFGDPTPGDLTMTVLRTRDGGTHWNRIATEPLAYSEHELGFWGSMAVTDTNHIWFATNGNWIRRTTDGGKTWDRIQFPHFSPWRFTFADSMQGLSTWNSTGTNKSGCDRTTDGGQTWTTVFARDGELTSYGLSSVPGGRFWMLDSMTVYEINAKDPLVLGLPAAGKITLPSPIIYGIDMNQEGDLLYGWLVTRTGKIYKCKQNAKSLLARTYTVGKTGYFPSLDSAFASLSSNGILGPVTLSLTDTLYDATTNTSGSYNLVGPIVGAGPASRITIRPANNVAVTIKGNGNAALLFENVSYLTLDGVSLQGNTRLKVHALRDIAKKYNDAIDLSGNADLNEFRHLTLRTDDYQRGSGLFMTTRTSGSPDSNLIENNVMSGAYVMYLSKDSLVHANPSHNIIRGNTVGSPSDTLGIFGILSESSDGTLIEGNTVQFLRRTDGKSEVCGIMSYADNSTIIRNNVVHALFGTNGASAVGISGSGKSPTYLGNGLQIYNNKVWDLKTTNTIGTTAEIIGMEALSQSGALIVYNTVVITGTGANPYGISALLFDGTTSGTTIRNNILVNTYQETNANSLVFEIVRGSPAFSSDYNDVYAGPFANSAVAQTGSGTFKALNDWQTTGSDQHSVSMSPMFFTQTLHIDTTNATTNALEGKGTPIAGILYDFEGGLRNATSPDIGADEFDKVTGITKDGSRVPDIFALLQNYPNPFNPATVISYQLPVNSYVTLKIFDLLGREVATLVNERKDAGMYSVRWNASGFATGMYLVRIQAGSFIDTKKVLLMK
jgi:photosystem II stability/assembly factor-like uncharacterized protein